MDASLYEILYNKQSADIPACLGNTVSQISLANLSLFKPIRCSCSQRQDSSGSQPLGSFGHMYTHSRAEILKLRETRGGISHIAPGRPIALF